MYGYVGLCMAMYGYVGSMWGCVSLCRFYVGLCMAMYGYAKLCRAM